MRALLTVTVTVALAGLAGCFSPSIESVQCGLGGLCPTGLVCDDTLDRCVDPRAVDDIDASVDSAIEVGDRDNDGHLDDVDNCPTIANEQQYDEDGDRVGDACDNCPARANDNQADGDDDLVGDACDPNPNASGDRIAFFDGFNLVRSPMWEPLEDEWEIRDGGLIGAEKSRQAIAIDLGISSGVIRTTTTVKSFDNTEQLPAIGLIAGLNSDGTIFCGDVNDNDANIGRGGIYEIRVNETEVITTPQARLALEMRREHTMTFRSNEASCVIAGTELAEGNLSPDPGQGRIGFGTIDATANYAYFIVFTTE